MNLTPFSVHHNGDGVSLVLVELPEALDDGAVPIAGAVAHVESRDVHAADGEGLELFEAVGGGADGADELGPPGAPESVLPELGLRDGIDLNGAGGSIVLRSRG